MLRSKTSCSLNDQALWLNLHDGNTVDKASTICTSRGTASEHDRRKLWPPGESCQRNAGPITRHDLTCTALMYPKRANHATGGGHTGMHILRSCECHERFEGILLLRSHGTN